MVVFRLIALVFIVAALMVLGYDAITSVGGGGGYHMLSVEGLWSMFDVASLDGFKTWYIETLPSPGPDVFGTVLTWPAFAVFGVFGLILAVLFRRRFD